MSNQRITKTIFADLYTRNLFELQEKMAVHYARIHAFMQRHPNYKWIACNLASRGHNPGDYDETFVSLVLEYERPATKWELMRAQNVSRNNRERDYQQFCTLAKRLGYHFTPEQVDAAPPSGLGSEPDPEKRKEYNRRLLAELKEAQEQHQFADDL